MTYIYTVSLNQTAQPGDINQFASILQRQSGQVEQGKYVAAGSSYAVGAYVSCYIPSLSRNATPVSLFYDEIDGVVNMTTSSGNPTSFHITSNGFQLAGTSNAVNVNCSVAGGYTLNY